MHGATVTGQRRLRLLDNVKHKVKQIHAQSISASSICVALPDSMMITISSVFFPLFPEALAHDPTCNVYPRCYYCMSIFRTWRSAVYFYAENKFTECHS